MIDCLKFISDFPESGSERFYFSGLGGLWGGAERRVRQRPDCQHNGTELWIHSFGELWVSVLKRGLGVLAQHVWVVGDTQRLPCPHAHPCVLPPARSPLSARPLSGSLPELSRERQRRVLL